MSIRSTIRRLIEPQFDPDELERLYGGDFQVPEGSNHGMHRVLTNHGWKHDHQDENAVIYTHPKHSVRNGQISISSYLSLGRKFLE